MKTFACLLFLFCIIFSLNADIGVDIEEINSRHYNLDSKKIKSFRCKMKTSYLTIIFGDYQTGYNLDMEIAQSFHDLYLLVRYENAGIKIINSGYKYSGNIEADALIYNDIQMQIESAHRLFSFLGEFYIKYLIKKVFSDSGEDIYWDEHILIRKYDSKGVSYKKRYYFDKTGILSKIDLDQNDGKNKGIVSPEYSLVDGHYVLTCLEFHRIEKNYLERIEISYITVNGILLPEEIVQTIRDGEYDEFKNSYYLYDWEVEFIDEE